MEKKKLNRLESLDVLRGFDLFCLVVLEMVLHPLAHAIDMPWFNSFMWGFSHVEWEGFSTWDLVMPYSYSWREFPCLSLCLVIRICPIRWRYIGGSGNGCYCFGSSV